ncbi:hypothetical protein HF086_008754 [Spodoptera exigua]|uniref:Uncharacterized protein n=1 Tax=Spodoptera exigua TaxID=7107 RepID=A0A922MB77_SPOEX|nr:hypothetical protein HF086_008754 [Spodoptera exigua]
MKASKDVYVTKRDIRLESNLLRDFEAYNQAAKEKDNLSLRNQQKTQEIGCQYDCRWENLKCTCKNLVAFRKKEEVRNIELPKQVYAYHRSRSSTEIGDTSNKNKETTSKCVGGTVKYNISCVMNEKLSPIVLTISGVTKSNRNAEIGSNSIIKSLTNTTTQFEDVNKQELRTEEIVQPIITVQDDLEDRKTNRHNSHNNYECIKEKINNPVGKAFSSDSLVQRVHNLDNLNEGKVSQNTVVIAPTENKLEKENKHVIDKSKSKDSKPADEKSITDLKSPSAFKRRFEAIRRSLAKREDLKKSATFTEAGQVSATSHKDVSINSDPPSLKGRTDSNARTYSPFSQIYSGDKTIYNPEASRHRRSMSGSNHWSSQRIDNDSECQGVKGKFQLWGKKCDEEEDCKRRCTPRPSYTTTRKRFNKKEVPKTLKKSDTIKKESRKFFFFKRKDKSSSKVNPFKPMVRKGVTAGRCEVRDGLVIKICGGANTAKEASKPPESVEDHGEIFRNGWLKEYLSQTIEPRNSVQVRWNNKKYAPSSSTVVELMDSVYKDSGLVIRSKSQVSVQPSYKPHTKQHVSFVKQRIEAWMIPRTVTDRPQMIPLKQNANENKNNNIEVTISDQKWCIDKSKAFSHKIEVVLHTQNFSKLNNEESSEYLRIDIPKGFFVDSSSDDTNKNIVVNQSSDEEVYKIVEYETGSDLKREKTQRSFYTGDHHKQNNIKVTVSVKEVKDGALKQDPRVQRDVVIQGSNVNVPLKCDVVGVGIITQRDLRDIRKPILKIQDDYSDEESDRDVPNANKKCELAKRFLQEFCRDWTHLSNDSWRASDPHMRYCSATSFHNEGMKSSPNMFDEFQTSAIVSSCPTSECIHCTPHLQNLEQDKKSKKCKWFKRKKKKEQKNKDENFQRTRPKDSIEVCKRRRVHALLKSKWVCPYSDHDRPYSLVTSNESRANQHLPTTECPKLMKSCCKTVDPRPRRRKCKKHVSLPDCDTMNDLLARHLNGPEGILAFKGAGGCELCKRKVCPKHTTINHDVSGEIPRAPCKESCEQMKKPPCAKDSSSTSPDSPKPAPSPCPPTPSPCPPPPRPPSPCPPCTPPPPPCAPPPPPCNPPPPPCNPPPPPSAPPPPPCTPPPPPCAPPPPPCTPPPPPCAPSPQPCAQPPCTPAPPPCAQMPTPCSPSPPPCSQQPICIIKPPPCLPACAGSADAPSPCFTPPPCCKSKEPPSAPCQRTPPSPPPCRQPISSEPPCRNPNCPHTSPHRKIPSCRTPPNNPSSSPSNRRSPARQANAKSPRSPSSSNPCPHIRIVTCPSPPVCPYFSPPCPNLQPCPHVSTCTLQCPPPPCQQPPCPPPPCPPPPCPPPPCQPPPCQPPPCQPPPCQPPPCQPPPCPPPPCPPPPCYYPPPCPRSLPPCRRPSGCIPPPCPGRPPPCWDPCMPPPCPPPSCPPPPCPPPPCPPPPCKPPPCPRPTRSMNISPIIKKPSRKKPMCIGSLPNDCLPLPQCPSSLCRAMPCQTSPPRLQNRSSANHYEKLSDSCSYNCIQSSPEAPFFYSPIHPCPIEPEKCEKPVIPCKSSPCNTHRPDYTPSVECGSSVPPVYRGPRACDECQSSDVNVFPWPTKNQVSNQSSMASLYNASTQPDKIVYGKCKKDCPMLPKLSCETIPSPKKECPSSCPNKQGSPRPPCMPKIQCPQPRPPPKPKPPPPAEPICRPSKCKSKSKLSGLFLKMNPIKNKKSMCSKDCLAWKTNYKGEDGCISLNSEERITIRLKKDSPCTQDATEGYNIKVQDEDGITLFERKDYRLQRAGCSIKRPSLLDDMYRASEVRRVTTNDSVNPIRNKDKECFKEILEVKSDASIANLIEIQFKLKVTQGDNTTEVNIGNDEFKDNETKENIQETLNQAAQEVYMVKNESEEVVDNCDQKNDINIRIVIKNFKSKTGNKKINLKHDSYSKNFAEKISAKFHTVSTGYSDVLHDDKVFSIHRATVDLTSSVENTKTQSIKSEECISESMLTAEGILADYSEPSICRCIAADLSNGGKGEDIESKSFASQKLNGSKENHLINQDKLTNRMSEYNKDSNTKKPSKNRTQETDTDKPIELEYELETDTEKRAEIAETKQLSSIEVIVKPYTKDEKKELLKQIFEKANDNKPKTKGRMKKLREMLKVILTSDSSEADDPNLTSTEIPNNEIFASLKPNDFKDNGSMNTFYTEESNRLLLGIDTKAIHPTAENNSECSNSNSEVSVSSDTEAPKVSACMCSTVAARLKMASRFGEGGCCCTKQIDQRNEEITCDIKPDSDFHYLKHELNDVEIQRSTYLSSKVNSTKLSVHRKNIRPSETDSIVLKDESGLIGEKSWSQTNIIRQCEMKKVKEGDKNVLMSNHTSKFTDNRNKEKKEFIDPPVKINASDILQSYEVKKAVLEMYTEKTICDDGEHLVAKLPKFVYDRRK